jgi:hypothetical protein
MKCTSCNWIGSRGELVIDRRLGQNCLDENFFKLTNWNCCPRCNRTLIVKDSHNEISLAFNNSVFCIDSPLHNKPTHIHLCRILDFSVSPFGISFLGYKTPAHLAQTFKLTVLLNGFEDHKFESLIILKMLYEAHKNKYRCVSKDYNGYKLFGNEGGIPSGIYPFIKCSFCARYYEYTTNQKNGWPLSIAEIEKIKTNKVRKLLDSVSPRSNNKFSMLFGSKEIEEEQTICCCNEISNTLDCAFHKPTKLQ